MILVKRAFLMKRSAEQKSDEAEIMIPLYFLFES